MKEKKNNHSGESVGSSAFWGVCCESGKRYAHVPKKTLHVTMAVLDVTVLQTTDVVSVVMEISGNQHILCHLSKQKMPQVNLDLLFEPGEKVTFFIKGVGVVYLNGYLIGQEVASLIGGLNHSKSVTMAESSEEDSSTDSSVEAIKTVKENKVLDKALKLTQNQKSTQDKSPKVEEAKSPVKSNNTLRCDMCDVTAASAKTMEEHLKGKKHRMKVRTLKKENNAGKKENNVPAVKEAKSPVKSDGSLKCDACDLTVQNAKEMDIHLKSRQHRALSFASSTLKNSELDMDDSDEDDDDFELDDEEFDESSDEDGLSDEDEDDSSDEEDTIKDSAANAKSSAAMSDDESSEDDSSDDEDSKKASALKSGKRPADSKPGMDKNANKKVKISPITPNSKEGKKSLSANLNSSVGHTPMPNAKAQKDESDDDSPTAKKLSFSETPSKKKKNKRKSSDGEKPKTPGSAMKTMPGGMELVDVRTGSGPAATSGKLVHVYYEGSLENGKVFDRCQKGKPFSFKLGSGQVIEGWEKGIEGMRVGGMRKLKIPPALAYKNKAVGDIPSNSTLNFVVTLKAVS